MFSPSYLATCAEHAAQLLRQELLADASSFKAYRWDSDFAHDPNWAVVPLYMNYQWCSQEMHTFTHPLSPLGKGLFVENLNTTAFDRFPNVMSILDEFIDTKLVNYIGVSLLPPNTVLHPHKHSNPGNLKLHSCVLSPSSCGLSYSDDSQTYQHEWSSPVSSVYFDDNFLHSAWNNSSSNRYILIMDFNKTLLSSSN